MWTNLSFLLSFFQATVIRVSGFLMIFSCSKDGIIKITVLKWQTWFGDEAREKIRQLGHQDRNLGSVLVHLQAMLYGPLWHLRLFYQPCCYLTYLRNELKACGRKKKGCGIQSFWQGFKKFYNGLRNSIQILC